MLFYTADSHITNFIFVAADFTQAAANVFQHQQAIMPAAASHSRPIAAADIKRPHICRN